MKECMTQSDPPKEASTFERMIDRPQLLFSNKMIHYPIEWTTSSSLLKQIYYTHKKFDASNRFS